MKAVYEGMARRWKGSEKAVKDGGRAVKRQCSGGKAVGRLWKTADLD